MIIAIDFDGTIIENTYPEIRALKKNAKKYLQKLHEDGHIIIIWTCRKKQALKNAVAFLDKEEIPYHLVNKTHPKIWPDSYPKIFADMYIDDKQVGGLPDDWAEIYRLIQKDILKKGVPDSEKFFLDCNNRGWLVRGNNNYQELIGSGPEAKMLAIQRVEVLNDTLSK